VLFGEGDGGREADDLDELFLQNAEVGVAFFKGEAADGEADRDVVTCMWLGGCCLLRG